MKEINASRIKKSRQKDHKNTFFKIYFLSPLSEMNVFLFAAGWVVAWTSWYIKSQDSNACSFKRCHQIAGHGGLRRALGSPPRPLTHPPCHWPTPVKGITLTQSEGQQMNSPGMTRQQNWHHSLQVSWKEGWLWKHSALVFLENVLGLLLVQERAQPGFIGRDEHGELPRSSPSWSRVFEGETA